MDCDFDRSAHGDESPRFRIDMTARCRDCDHLPKVDGAGEVFESDGRRVQRMHNGLLVLADGYYGSEMTEIIALTKGLHEPQEELAFHHVLDALPTAANMIELGAYWSYYSLWFKSRAPGERRAVALEPIEKHVEVGHANAALNGMEIEFLVGAAGGTPLPSMKLPVDERRTIDVRQYSVPEIMALKGMEHLDVLHCDAQGAELDVILGCRELFEKGRVSFVFLSTHHHNISKDYLTHQRCLAALRDMGATILADHDVNESFSGDGLIVAQFGESATPVAPFAISYNRYSEALFRNPLYDLAEIERPANALKAALSNSTVGKLLKRFRSYTNFR